jgi:hypothetical protein
MGAQAVKDLHTLLAIMQEHEEDVYRLLTDDEIVAFQAIELRWTEK